MNIKTKNTKNYYWTQHSLCKMRYYGISSQRVLGIISKPKRKEEGIVKNTIAVMKPVSSKVVNGKEIWKQEIWVMFQKINSANKLTKPKTNKLKIISAWRYPGVSPKKNPVPEEILNEITGTY